MTREEAEIAFVHLDKHYVELTDGVKLPITDWIGSDGEDCDPEDATVIVAGYEGYGWITVELGDEA